MKQRPEAVIIILAGWEEIDMWLLYDIDRN